MDKPSARKAALEARQSAKRGAEGARGEALAGAHLSAVLAEHPGKVLAGYMPIRDEIDPLPVMRQHQGPLVLPVVMGKGCPLCFRRWSFGAPLIEGAFGARVPAQEEGTLEPDLLIVPLVGFDARGNRLGYGGGFYDRTLERLRAARSAGQAPLAIGFAFAAQELPAFPLEPTDQRLDLIVTERGVRRFEPPLPGRAG